MALTPEQIDLLADKYITGLFQQLENDVIADAVRRVQKTGRYTETAELMAKSMVENGYSATKIRAEVLRSMRADKALQDEIAMNTKEYKEFVTSEIKATVKAAKQAGNDLVADAGMMAYNNDLSMWEKAGQSLSKPNSLSQIMDAFKKQTADELRNLTRTTGFKGTVLQPVMSAYQREMDMALVKLATGTFWFDQICNDIVHNLAQSGLRSIDYANGRSMQLDTAARLSVRTGMSQLSGRITEANIESTGVDLVITSQHMGSRPEHAEWQGKVFCYKGKTKKYPNFEESTGYGTVTGLKGANCSHDFYPYWEGISVKEEPLKEPDPVMVDGKEYDYYAATQKQRLMERNIRATKREIEAQKAIGGDTSVLQANLRKQTADYHMFSKDVGIRAKDNRLRLEKSTSNLSKNSQNKINKRVRYGEKKTNVPITDDYLSEKIGTKVDLKRMNESVASEYRVAIEDFYNQYPKLKGYLDEINTNISTFGATGQCDVAWEYKGIKADISAKVSFRQYKDYQSYINDISENFKNGSKFENDDAKANANHELTHALQQLLCYSERGLYSNGKFIEQSIMTDLNKKFDVTSDSNKIVRSALKKVGGKNYDYHELTDFLGTYAQSNNTEMIAQAMSYEMSGRTNHFSAEIKRQMDERYNKM